MCSQTQDHPAAPLREQDAEAPAHHCEHHAFGQQLPNQSHGPCANRRTHGDFSLACGRPGQEQISNVGAGNQQDEPYHDRQYAQRFGKTAPQGVDALTAGVQFDSLFAKVALLLLVRGPVGHLVKDLSEDDTDTRQGLLLRYARL